MSDLIKTVVVTGASRGIGRIIAQRAAEMGFQIYITYVSRPELADVVCAEIESRGGACRSFCLDISDREAVNAFFAEHVRKKVFLSGLVNNAGMTSDALLVRMKPEQWDNVIAVNLSGTFYCMQAGAQIMMRQKAGRIVNITSVVGQSGNPGQINYSAAKAGVIGMTKSAAQELGPRNITVNAVAPGFIETDMTAGLSEELRSKYLERIPLRALGDAEQVAESVAYLLSDKAGYVTGQVLGVNGGLYM